MLYLQKTILIIIILLNISSISAQHREAKDIVQESGVKGGLIVHLGGKDIKFTASLRINDHFIVQGLVKDASQVKKAREYLYGKKLLGSVNVIQWNANLLPYADNLVNLLVEESTRQQVSIREILRVLAPNGVAMINGKKTVKPRPPEIDEWQQYLHGADNNAVARDTIVAPPRYLQWVAGPRWARSHDHLASVTTVVSANGRLFYIVDEGSMASVAAPPKWMLVARDAFSGVLLWKKKIGPWEDHLRPFRSGPAEIKRRLVAVGDRVYLTPGYHKKVVALNAINGEEVRTYEGTKNTHEILYYKGILYFVISAPLKKKSSTVSKEIRRFDLWRDHYPEYIIEFMPKHIRANNAETGKFLWEKKDDETRNIFPLTLIAENERLFYENETHVVAMDIRSGRVLWRAKRPVARHRYAWLTPTVVIKDGVILSADRSPEKPVDTGGNDKAKLEWRVSANHLLEPGEIMAFSAKDGKKLWTAPCHEGFNSPADLFVIDGKVYTSILAWSKMPGITNVYDLKTGKVVARRLPDKKTYAPLRFGHHRCYRNKATIKYIIQGRRGVECLEPGSDRVFADFWVRGGCQFGILPCNGLIYTPSHSCACYVTALLNNFNALSGNRAIPFSEKPDRLEKGPSFSKAANNKAPSAETLVDSTEWPTYRHDNQRNGTTTASLKPNLKRSWEKAMPGPLSAIVVADGRLFVAQRETHTLHALNADDGSPIWYFTAGGRVDSPPTVWGDLVYFGSADGWIYCVRAQDGKLAWRFRMAPEPRQIVSYNQMESVWPVHGSILVCKGPDNRMVAYAAAGRSSFVDEGVYLYGVDALTGKIVVKKRFSSHTASSGFIPENKSKTRRILGEKPDILSSDGSSIFMRHTRMDLNGNSLRENVDHLYISVGFMDDSWWHRTYFQVGKSMNSGYGGWISEGNKRPSGQMLVRKDDRVYGFGRKQYGITGSHHGLNSESQIFCADTKPMRIQKKADSKKKGRRQSTQAKYHWSKDISFYVRTMVLAGDVLFIAGTRKITDIDSLQPSEDARLWALAAKDGKNLAKYKLDACPVYESFAVCSGRLYFTTVDGKVHCWEEK